MKDEIKEILDILQKCKDYDDEVYLIKQHGATLLLDYITNLQEENVVLKSQLLQDNKSYYDMKGRIKKAIEHIKINTKDNTFYEYYDGEVKDLLEILKGE